MAESIISQFGRYRVLAELGRGAMGVVYKAQDPAINRTVAIKTILMSPDAAEREEYEARFFQEAKAAGGLNHPGIITIHDVGREGDVAYMAMEFLEGVDLREVMQRERPALPRALDLMSQVAEALAFAHERGVIHRDIKPANIMIVRERYAKIMDFGIARMHISELKTKTGMMLGSPKYMSPEQVNGASVDHRSDIFSLGVVIYELAAGVSPYAAQEISGLMHEIVAASPPPPSASVPELPAMLDLIVARALAKDPASRYQSAAELAKDLRACLAELARELDTTQPAAQKSAPLDLALEPTLAVPGPAATSATTVAAARTLKLGEPAATMPGDPHLFVSRRFECAAALARLGRKASPPGEDGRVRLPRLVAYVWQDPDQRIVAVAIVAAAIVAIAIAFI